MIKHKYLYGFWERVEQACKKSGLSKSEIARRGGFDRRLISSPTTGMMHAMTLARFCAVTGASADWLLGLKSVPVKLQLVNDTLQYVEEP